MSITTQNNAHASMLPLFQSEYTHVVQLVGAPPRGFYEFTSLSSQDSTKLKEIGRKISHLKGVQNLWIPRTQQFLLVVWFALSVVGVVTTGPVGLMVASGVVFFLMTALALTMTVLDILEEKKEAKKRGEKYELGFVKFMTIYFTHFFTPGMHSQKKWAEAEKLEKTAEGILLDHVDQRTKNTEDYYQQFVDFSTNVAPKLISQLENGESIFKDKIKDLEKELAIEDSFLRTKVAPIIQQAVLLGWSACHTASFICGGVPGFFIATVTAVSFYIVFTTLITAYDFYVKNRSWNEVKSILINNMFCPSTYRELQKETAKELKDKIELLKSAEYAIFPIEAAMQKPTQLNPEFLDYLVDELLVICPYAKILFTGSPKPDAPLQVTFRDNEAFKKAEEYKQGLLEYLRWVVEKSKVGIDETSADIDQERAPQVKKKEKVRPDPTTFSRPKIVEKVVPENETKRKDALNLEKVKPLPLSDAGGSKLGGYRTIPEPIIESRALYSQRRITQRRFIPPTIRESKYGLLYRQNRFLNREIPMRRKQFSYLSEPKPREGSIFYSSIYRNSHSRQHKAYYQYGMRNSMLYQRHIGY